jgi:hypothetical protein
MIEDIPTIQLIADLIASPSSIGSLPQGPFDEAEQLLLDEARSRFDFEQGSAGALQSKSTLFLTLTGVFAAVVTSSIGRVLERAPSSYLEKAALGMFVLSLAIMTVAGILLARSTLSRNYQIIAGPADWLRHLGALQEAYKSHSDPKSQTFSRLRRHFLYAWVEAAEMCSVANEAKAAALERVFKLLCVAVPMAFLSILFLLLQTLLR